MTEFCDSSYFINLGYPKVAHAVNLGSATRDDSILSEATVLKKFVNNVSVVEVEEKLDGINCGIRIVSNGTILLRSRKKENHLDSAAVQEWLRRHDSDIRKILRPCRDNLFGEWVHTARKISYSNLPGWFVAFDILDTTPYGHHFQSRKSLTERLSGTAIPTTNLLYRGTFSNMSHLLSFADSESIYGPRREGCVFRTYLPDGHTEFIAKIVSTGMMVFT